MKSRNGRALNRRTYRNLHSPNGCKNDHHKSQGCGQAEQVHHFAVPSSSSSRKWHLDRYRERKSADSTKGIEISCRSSNRRQKVKSVTMRTFQGFSMSVDSWTLTSWRRWEQRESEGGKTRLRVDEPRATLKDISVFPLHGEKIFPSPSAHRFFVFLVSVH